MKKVSVGVFAILTAFVVVKSGRAGIASQGYVDSQVYHLASKEYVDTNFQKLNKKVTSDNYEQLVEIDKNPKTDLYTSLEYVDSQNALDEKVANKATGAEDFENMSDTDKANKYTSVAAAEKIAADAVKGATGAVDMGPVNAEAGKYFKQIKVEDGTMSAEQEAFVSDVKTNSTSLVAPQTAAVKKYVDDQDALDEKVANKLGQMEARPVNPLKGRKDGTFAGWFNSEVQDPLVQYPSASATKTMIEEALGDLSYNTAPTMSPTVERPMSFVSKISQRDGLISPTSASFLSSLVGDGVNLWNAPTGNAVIEYAETLANKATTSMTDVDIERIGRDVVYPTLAKTEALDAATLQSAKDYTDGRIQDIQTGIGARYQTLDEKLTSADTTTVVNDTNKDKLYPTVGKVREMDAEQTATITEAYEEADAATLQTANAYTDGKIEDIETGIGTNYQKLEERVETVQEYTDLAKDAKGTKYASVSLTEYIAQEAAKAAIAQLQAIVNVPAKCANKNNYCVLTTNGTNFVWEVIERSTSIDFPEPEPDSGEDAERMLVYEIPAE